MEFFSAINKLLQLILALFGVARSEERREAKIDERVEHQLREIADEVEARDDARTESELRDILSGE